MPDKLILPFSVGQKVKILPVVKEFSYPVRKYLPGEAIIVEVEINGYGDYNYGIISTSGDSDGWWYPHECMELLLGGKITKKNFLLAVKTMENL